MAADRVGEGRGLTRGSGRRVAMVLAAGAAVVVLAGCGAAGSGAPSQYGRQQLRRALRAWSGFAVSTSPRPLVLVGSQVADPASGFPSSAVKLAYFGRAVTAPPVLPPGPPAASGYPLISAGEAFTVFKSTAGKGPPSAAVLKISTVRLGAGVFQTDRGPRRLPAWLFRFPGVRGAAAVLAVSPARIFSPPGPPAAVPPFVTGARLGPDGRTLTVEFTGASSGTGPCAADYRLELAQSREAIAVAVREHDHSTHVACSAVGYPRHVTTVLSAPLGARVIVDAASRTAVATSEPAQAS